MYTAYWGLLIGGILLGASAQAQTQSLAQCLEQALANNSNVRAAVLDGQITDRRVKEVWALARPQVNFSADYKHYFKIPPQVIPASVFGGPAGQFNEAAFGLPWNLGNNVQATQTLFNANVFNAARASKLGAEISGLQLQKAKQDVAYQVSTAYYNAQALARQQAFLRANAEALGRTIATTELLYQNQLARRTDVDKLRLSKAGLENQVLTLEASRLQLVNLLKLLMGKPQEEPLEIEAAPEVPANPAPLAEPGQANRLELALLGKQQEANLLEQRSIRDGFMPVLNAYGLFNYTGYAIGGESSYFNFLSGSWAGIQLQWNVFDGGARRQKLAAKRLEAEKLNVQLAQLTQNVQMELTNAGQQQQVQNRALALNAEQVRLAERVFAQTQLQVKEGTASITDLIQSENALREAQTNFSTAYIKFQMAQLDQRKAAGTILD
jgi:outer membrane protein